MDLKQMAARILAVTQACPKWKEHDLERIWYMLNIRHPVINRLVERYRRKNGIPYDIPLSDMERLTFELALLRPAALREVETAVVEAERAYHIKNC